MSASAPHPNLTSPAAVRALLRDLGVRPSKGLGQNFLIDANILAILAAGAELTGSDVVLEVGPGLGVLTEALLARAAGVIAVEVDRRLCDWLRHRFGGNAGFELVAGDVLEADLPGLLSRATKIVANLPYRVGSRFLAEVSRAADAPGLVVATVQSEVAERLAARAGEAARGVLSVWVQSAYEVETLKTVSRNCFLPRPEIESAIVRLRRRSGGQTFAPGAGETFFALLRHAFARRRKQMAGILAAAPPPLRAARGRAGELLAASGIDPDARPEALDNDQWARLANALTTRP